MKKKLKIFYLYYDYPDVVPIHSHEVITQFARKGNIVRVFCHIGSNSRILKKWHKLNIQVVNIASPPIRIACEICYLINLFFTMFFYCHYLRPDLIYIRHGSPSLIGVIVGRLYKIPVCLEVNDILIKRMEFKGIRLFKKVWIKLYERISFTFADRIFPVTKGISKWVCGKYEIQNDRVITIPNGVNDQRFSPGKMDKCRNKYGLTDKRFIVGYLGSLFHWSGIECLIEAVPLVISALPKAFFIIGGGEEPYYSKLVKKVQDKKLSAHIKFFGRIEWNNAASFINAMDICVAPAYFDNLESEISSQKLLAYLACGKPVVGSNITGMGDMLEKHGIGVSFPMGNHKALASTIIDFYSNRKRINEMGNRGRKFVVNKYSWSIIVDKIIKACENMIRAKKI